MVHVFNAPTATELMDQITDRLVFAPHPDAADQFPGQKTIDMAAATDTHILNVVAEADSFQWDFDLKDGWMLPTRWSTLVRQYVNPTAFDQWLDLIKTKMPKKNNRGTAVMRMNTVAERGSAKRKSRRWGSCMLAISFRRVPWPQITLYSRTSYFGYIANLDMTVAHTAAKYVSELLDIPVEEMRFVWHIEDAQWSWKSMAWLLMDEERAPKLWDARAAISAGDDDSDALWDKSPGLYVAALWFDRFLLEDEEGVKYGDMSWASCARVRRRFHTEVMGPEYGKPWEGGTRLGNQVKVYRPLKSHPVSGLDFEAIYRRNKNAVDEEISNTLTDHTTEECLCTFMEDDA